MVEVIATILVTAIIGAIFINFMGSAMSRSVRSVEMVRGEADAEAVLEKIIADHALKMNQDSGTALGLMEAAINNAPKAVYGSNVSAAYIRFDSNGNEIADTIGENRTLKVTVAASGNDLIILLAKTRGLSSSSPPVPF
jgi:hypothetical protein